MAKPNYATGSLIGGTPGYGATPGQNTGSGVTVTGGGGEPNLPRTIPTRPIRTQAPEATQIDPAQQYINMAIQKQQMESRRIPMPPLPPIPGLDLNQ